MLYSTPYKSIDRSTLTTHYSHRNSPTSSSSTIQIGSKIIYDETWLSNKSYNPRVAACVDHIYENINAQTEQISKKHRLTHKISKRQIPRERIYSQKIEKTLYLNIAINGASKSLRGQVPVSNLDLQNGDFGDDAGIFTENQDFCFVGKYKY